MTKADFVSALINRACFQSGSLAVIELHCKDRQNIASIRIEHFEVRLDL